METAPLSEEPGRRTLSVAIAFSAATCYRFGIKPSPSRQMLLPRCAQAPRPFRCPVSPHPRGLRRIEAVGELVSGVWGIPEPPADRRGPEAAGRPGGDRPRRRPRARLRPPRPAPRLRQGLLRPSARPLPGRPGRALLRRPGVPRSAGRPPRRGDGLRGHGGGCVPRPPMTSRGRRAHWCGGRTPLRGRRARPRRRRGPHRGARQRWVGMLKSARSRAPDGQRWVIVFSRV